MIYFLEILTVFKKFGLTWIDGCLAVMGQLLSKRLTLTSRAYNFWAENTSFQVCLKAYMRSLIFSLTFKYNTIAKNKFVCWFSRKLVYCNEIYTPFQRLHKINWQCIGWRAAHMYFWHFLQLNRLNTIWAIWILQEPVRK